MQDRETRTRGARDRPEIGDAIAALQRLSELFALRRRQLAREVDLNESQWRLLEEIADEDFMPSLFARRRDCTPAAVSRGLRSLLDRDLVDVGIGADDGRQRVYRLTAEGRRLLRRLRSGRERAIAAVWAQFDAKTLRRFTHFADTLADELASFASSAETGTERSRRSGSAS